MDPEHDPEALDAMLKGISNNVAGDAAKDSDEDKEPERKGSQLKKGDKLKKSEKTTKGDRPPKEKESHGPPDSESEREDDPEDIRESWMTTIMKDVQQARRIQLGLKHQPTQKYQAQALLEEAKKFEDYWSRMNAKKKKDPRPGLLSIKKCHDEIGYFRKQTKVTKVALAGVEEKKKKTKKDGPTSRTSGSERSGE